MTGVDIIGTLARGFAPLIAELPIIRIMGGEMAEGQAVESILLRTVSVNRWQPLAGSSKERLTERVEAMVRARTYDRQRLLIRLIGRACNDKTGDIAGAEKVSVLFAGIGPDIRTLQSFDQAHDFRVSYQRNA